jgi:hypothetical protein
MSKQDLAPIEFVCDVTALNAQERKRYERLREKLPKLVEEIREVAKGYALRHSAEISTFLLLAEFVSLESRCCPFLSFTLELKPRHGPVWLMLTGPEGVKEFLQAELEIDPGQSAESSRREGYPD